MFYKVEKEECGKGIKKRYDISQIIDSNEVEKIKCDFSQYHYTFYDDRKRTKLEFYDFGIFREKIFVYYIDLLKK